MRKCQMKRWSNNNILSLDTSFFIGWGFQVAPFPVTSFTLSLKSRLSHLAFIALTLFELAVALHQSFTVQ